MRTQARSGLSHFSSCSVGLKLWETLPVTAGLTAPLLHGFPRFLGDIPDPQLFPARAALRAGQHQPFPGHSIPASKGHGMGDCSQPLASPWPRSPSLVASPAVGSVTVPWQGWPCFLVKPNLMLTATVPPGLTHCHPILPSVPGQPLSQTTALPQCPSSQLILPSIFFFSEFQRIYTSPWIFPLEPAQGKCLHSLGMQTGPWKLLPLGTPRAKG